ncbi:hypothetical protein H0H92_006986 [Tricholoma furcatifolium]|nr:hypothetical protein H0H92_006986 [Tricholoma furcatifolium]
MASRNDLIASAQQLKKDIDTLISHFSTTQQITAFEHGEPSLAPFLGRQFVGSDGVRTYFETIASLLSYENMVFSDHNFVVDVESRKVATKASGRFTWKSTGESWDEIFAYMLSFDEENKVVDYQVWADSGAAYLASKGILGDTRGRD